MATAPDSDFALSSRYTAGSVGKPARYEIRLENQSATGISNFALGVSGPTRLSGGAMQPGKIVAQLSNWCEIAAPQEFVLEPGAAWTVTVDDDDLDLRHWTDGVAGAMLILADRSVTPVTTRPPTTLSGTALPVRGVMRLPTTAAGPPYSMVPWPNSVDVSGHRTTPAGLTIVAGEAPGHAAATSFRELTKHLFPGEGLARSVDEGGYQVVLRSTSKLPPETYRIEFSRDGATVEGSTGTALLYGLITLGQMVRGGRLAPHRVAFPLSGHIQDGPAMRWRGCHLDVARRFYSAGEVAQFLRIMAWNKLNRFHWHLSDDEGWRLAIDAYPELTATGAWRGYGMPIPPLLGTGPERTGGYYTKAAVRELVALGDDLGIEIVPEIDLPGHCHALLTAMPDLKDPREDGRYQSLQGFPNNCLNPGIEMADEVVRNIFAEVCDLFPSRYVHIGADEVPADAWLSSPSAQNRLRSIGGTGTADLQAAFTKRLQAFLTGQGKITGAWQEAAETNGIDRTNCYVVGWQSFEAGRALAAGGFDVVISPGQAYYLDMANGPDWSEPGANWAGCSSPENTYAYSPGAGWNTAERSHLLGVQACIWSEPMADPGVFDRLVFPRLSAIAEAGWTAPDHRSWARFSALAGFMPTLYGTDEH